MLFNRCGMSLRRSTTLGIEMTTDEYGDEETVLLGNAG